MIANTRKDVHDARRETGFKNQFSDAQCSKRSLLGGFEHDGVAGRQGGSEFHAIHEKRKIPRSDLADDAYGLMPRVAEIISVNGNGLAVILVGPSSEIPELAKD